MFSEEECERLAEILSDPVLKKFQKRKIEYFSRMLSLAERYLEHSAFEPGDFK